MKTENSPRETSETWQSPESEDVQLSPIPKEEDELQGKAFQRHTQASLPQSRELSQLQASSTKETPLKERGLKKALAESPIQFSLVLMGKIIVPEGSRLGRWLEKQSLRLQGYDSETLMASNMEKLIKRLRHGIETQEQHMFRDCGVVHKVTDLIKKMGSVHLTSEDLKDPKASSSAFKELLRNEEIIPYSELLPVIEVFQKLTAAGELEPWNHPSFLDATRQLLAGKKEYHKKLILEICSMSGLIDLKHVEGENLNSTTFAVAAGTSLVKLDINTDSTVSVSAQMNRVNEQISNIKSVFKPFLEAVNQLEAETAHTPHQPYPGKKEPTKQPLPLPPKVLARRQQALKAPEQKQEPATQVKPRVEAQIQPTTPREQKKAKQPLPLPQKAREKRQQALQAEKTRTAGTRRAKASATIPRNPPKPTPQGKSQTRPDISLKPNLRHQGQMVAQNARDKYLLGIQKPQYHDQAMEGVFNKLTDQQTQAKEAKEIIDVYDRLIPDSVKIIYQGEIIDLNPQARRNTQEHQSFLQNPVPKQISALKKIGLPPFASKEQILFVLADKARKSWEGITSDTDMEAHNSKMKTLKHIYKLLFLKP